MARPNPHRQRAARDILRKLFADAANVSVIHYSCQSFYGDNPASRRITSIAVRKLDSAQTLSFSIHKIAEEQRVAFEEIEQHYDDLEKRMLDEFYGHVGSHKGMKYLHWNMRDGTYGFAAIEHRHRVLAGSPAIIADDKKFDLARLLIDIFGAGYSAHPRLESLIKLNHIKPLDFLNGDAEAKAFERRNFVALHQSTLRKVDIIANLAQRADDGQLNTLTRWWEMRGGTVWSFVDWFAENKKIRFVLSLWALGSLVVGAIGWLLMRN